MFLPYSQTVGQSNVHAIELVSLSLIFRTCKLRCYYPLAVYSNVCKKGTLRLSDLPANVRLNRVYDIKKFCNIGILGAWSINFYGCN